MFVNPQERVPVSDEAGNTIWIRAKMDLQTRSRVQDEVAAMTRGQDDDISLHIGSYRMATLVWNIVAWEGPAFEGRACTPQNIKLLDPNEPLIDLVAEEISTRNARPEAPEKN